MQVTQVIRRAVQTRGRGTATIFGSRQRTWLDVSERIARFAGALKTLGVVNDTRIAILALNSDRYMECLYATNWAGGITVPLNFRLTVPELVYMLNDSGAEILIVDDTFRTMAPDLRPCAKTVRQIISIGEQQPIEGQLSYEDLIVNSSPAEDALRDGDDVAGIFYTGGTTGQPKGVMLTHNNVAINALSAVAALSQLDDSSVYLHAAPMFHLGDGGMLSTITLVAGTHVFIPMFEAKDALKAINNNGVTVTLLVPTMVRMLLDQFDFSPVDLSSLKMLIYGASPMPAALIARALGSMPHVKFWQGYGMTELSPYASVMDAKYHVLTGPFSSKLKSAGRAVPMVEIKVADDNDQEVPCGTIGEILVRGPSVMKGYWNMPELTAETLRGGWMHTGDVAYMDEDGFIFVVDRTKDMIISGGENVYSAEVEDAIYKHPAVAMCAVIGIPSEKWGEQVHAIVVAKTGHVFTEAEIIEHCRALIAHYKCPRSAEIRQELLPLSGAGKILKRQLRTPYWKTQERQIH